MTLLLLILAAIAIYYFFIYKGNGVYKINTFIKTVQKRCPNCKNPVEDSFNICPVCKETLKRKCSNCGERINAEWMYCPYCENIVAKSETK